MVKISAILFSILLFQACATYKTVVPSSQKNIVQYVDDVKDENVLQFQEFIVVLVILSV